MKKTAPDLLIIQETDNEMAEETQKRFAAYVEKEPDKIHVAPYLTNIYFTVEGWPVLFWAHRIMRNEAKTFTIEEKFTKVNKTVHATLRYPAWVAGGEPEADIVCLGYTYIPKPFWDSIYPEIQNLDWRILDIEVSARMLRAGMKARIHWDTICNHVHVDIREREKSIFRKWTGIEKGPLTVEEKKFLGVEKLPAYHGFLDEPMLIDKEPKPNPTCPNCGTINTWTQLGLNEYRCNKCAFQFPSSVLYQK